MALKTQWPDMAAGVRAGHPMQETSWRKGTGVGACVIQGERKEEEWLSWSV